MMDTDPIDLYQCFKAFVRDDELGEEESWLVYYRTPQYTTVYYSTAQYATQYMTVYHSIPQYITVYHRIPQYIPVYHSIPQYTTVYSISLAGTVKSARNTRKQSRVWRYGVSLPFW